MFGGSKIIQTTNLPPQYIQAAQQAMLRQAQQWFSQGGTQLAGFTPDQLNSMRMLEQYAQGGLRQQAQNAAKSEAFLTNPNLLNPSSNPYLAESVQAAIHPIQQNYQNVIMPSLNSGAAASGAYGGSRQGIAQALAAQNTGRQIGDISARMYSGAYQHGLDTMLNGLRMAPGIANMGLAPGQLLGNIGALKQHQQQAENNQNYNRLASYGNLIGAGKGSVQTRPGASVSPGASAFGGAVAGASVGTSIEPGWGTLIGAGIGALGGYASGGGFG